MTKEDTQKLIDEQADKMAQANAAAYKKFHDDFWKIIAEVVEKQQTIN